MQLERVDILNDKEINLDGEYVLYWMQAYRRLEYNHSLDFAIQLAEKFQKPLVVYEGLRMDYKWNSPRIHKFILEGMKDNLESAKKLGIEYYSFVETPKNPARGLLRKVSEKAVAVVTDKFPCFIIPQQSKNLAERISVRVYSIDGNGIIPLKLYGEFASAARILRPRIHKLFSECYIHTSKPVPRVTKLPKLTKSLPIKKWDPDKESIESILNIIPFENQVPSLPTKGGRKEALHLLDLFIQKKIQLYGEQRSNPHSPLLNPTSGLSPYIHFGFISIDEIVIRVLNGSNKNKWAPDLLNQTFKGKKEGYFHSDKSISDFLDELLTWRDIGYLMFNLNPEFRKDLKVLPDWLQKNNAKHKKDKREYLYSKDALENYKTHDRVWNAAQAELVLTGKMHNYMRMLWGKKVIEWTRDLEEAFDILEDFNNKYALDGRNPNSYTGILWCFGLFDRPWFPERNVFGNIRFMSSDSTMKKFKMDEYLLYVENLKSGIGLFN